MTTQIKLFNNPRKKFKRLFKVVCPNVTCRKTQTVEVEGSPAGKRKTCTYCGRSFIIHRNINNSQIIKELK